MNKLNISEYVSTLINIGDPLSNILNILPNIDILNMRCVNIYLNDFICNNLNIEKREFEIKWQNIRNIKAINNYNEIRWMIYDIDISDYGQYPRNYIFTDHDIENLHQMTSLDVANTISISIDCISRLTNLTHLSIYNTNIVDIGNLTSLKSLTTGFFTKNSDIVNMTNLETLVLNSGLVTREGLLYLSNLTRLDISCNHYTRDNDICHLTSIKELQIADSNISDDFIVNFTQLEYLAPNDNITDKSLKFLTNLKALNLQNNRSITIDGLRSLTSLIDLDLNMNMDTNITEINHLTNLTRLDLSNNNTITDVAIDKLTMLKELNLSRNNTITDNALTKLSNLTLLNLCFHFYDGITAEGINKLPNLEKVYLYNCNHITKESLGKINTDIDTYHY